MDRIYATVDKTKVRSIANDILNDNLSDIYNINKNPQICIVPYFNSTIPVNIPKFESYYNIDISGFKYYTDVNNPMIIKLDVSDDSLIQLWRDELVDQIGKKSIHTDLEKPSIDILIGGKIGGENYFDIDPYLRDNIIDICESYELPNKIKLYDVNRESE